MDENYSPGSKQNFVEGVTNKKEFLEYIKKYFPNATKYDRKILSDMFDGVFYGNNKTDNNNKQPNSFLGKIKYFVPFIAASIVIAGGGAVADVGELPHYYNISEKISEKEKINPNPNYIGNNSWIKIDGGKVQPDQQNLPSCNKYFGIDIPQVVKVDVFDAVEILEKLHDGKLNYFKLHTTPIGKQAAISAHYIGNEIKGYSTVNNSYINSLALRATEDILDRIVTEKNITIKINPNNDEFNNGNGPFKKITIKNNNNKSNSTLLRAYVELTSGGIRLKNCNI